MLNLKINGRDYEVPEGITVLEAARYAKIDIPTLCYLREVNCIGACRICLVEVKGARGPVAAINGTVKQPHVIDQSKCIKCGLCESSCKFKAIVKK